MGKSLTGHFVVLQGQKIDLYSNWNDCYEQIKKNPNAKFRQFLLKRNAIEFIKRNKIYARYVFKLYLYLFFIYFFFNFLSFLDNINSSFTYFGYI